MFPLLRKKGTFRLYPKKLNYLFLAVFAFFSPFCYAKTAFSYSPNILSPCTPDVTMVKNVVKTRTSKMQMWSPKNRSTHQASGSGRKEKSRRTKHGVVSAKPPNRNMWSRKNKLRGQAMWSGRAVAAGYCFFCSCGIVT